MIQIDAVKPQVDFFGSLKFIIVLWLPNFRSFRRPDRETSDAGVKCGMGQEPRASLLQGIPGLPNMRHP